MSIRLLLSILRNVFTMLGLAAFAGFFAGIHTGWRILFGSIFAAGIYILYFVMSHITDWKEFAIGFCEGASRELGAKWKT